MLPLLAWLAPAWLALAPASTALQEPEVPAPAQAEADVHERMRRLVQDIERTLRRIDGHLWGDPSDEAAAAAAPLLARLEAARAGARQVIDDIDLLLRIGEHPHESGGGGT